MGDEVYFSPIFKNRHLTLEDDNRTVTCEKRWGSCGLQCGMLTSGCHFWEFRINSRCSGGGILIGIADEAFDLKKKNVGAQSPSWGLSGSSGDVGDGSGGFFPFGEPYGSGDVVGMCLDLDQGLLRYWINGRDQGVAVAEGLLGRSLQPAVCLGGAEDGKHSITLLPERPRPLVTNLVLNPNKRGPSLKISNGGRTASSSARKWGSVLALVEPVTTGVHYWEFKVDERHPGGGVLIGVAEAGFNASQHNLGAEGISWGLSGASGDIGDGTGQFVPFSEPYGSGDVIALLLDMDAGTLRYFKDGRDLGVAVAEGIQGRALLPGVCMGGASGGAHQVTLLTPDNVPKIATCCFHPTKRAPHIHLSAGDRRATSTGEKWGSVLFMEQAKTGGRAYWEVEITKRNRRGGVLVGIVSEDFDPLHQNVGAHMGSWGLSGASGDFGDGTGMFVPFSDPFGTGDVVGMLLDLDAGTLIYFKNGQNLGVAVAEGLRGRGIIPAVCMGGDGHEVTILENRVIPEVSSVAFNPSKRAPFMRIVCSGRTVENDGTRWGSCAVLQDPVSSGRHFWEFKVEERQPGGGILIGLIDQDFKVGTLNVGAQGTSWGMSGASGDVGDGSGQFVPFCEGFGTGDVVGMLLDMDMGTLRFLINGKDKGIAVAQGLKGRAILPAVCLGGAESGVHSVTILPKRSIPVIDALCFHPSMKARHIQLVDGGRTAVCDVTRWGTAMVMEAPVVHGRHFWEFKVEERQAGGGILIGIVEEDFKPSVSNVGAQGTSWGLSGASGDVGDGSGQFVPFCEGFGTGDVVGMLLDMDMGTLRFLINGRDKGIAFAEGLKGRSLLPAVCLGGATGGSHIVTLLPRRRPPDIASVTFNPSDKSRHVEIVNAGRTLRCASSKWGSCPLLMKPIMAGRRFFEFKVDSLETGGGILIGVYGDLFDPRQHNVGAQGTSWGLSLASGDIGDGSGMFAPFSDGFEAGDVLGMIVDRDSGSVRYLRNNQDLGVAFSNGLNDHGGLLPAVCLGGALEGAHSITVLPPRDPPEAYALCFNPETHPESIILPPGRRSALCQTTPWGSVLALMDPVDKGVHFMEFRVDSMHETGGIVIGIAGDGFDPFKQNIGAQGRSWGLSLGTGEFGDGSGKFIPYCPPLEPGDVLSMLLDLDAGSLRYLVNSQDCGVACCIGLRNVLVTPGVCLGGCDGGTHKVTILDPRRPPAELTPCFSPIEKAASLTLLNGARTAQCTTEAWGSVELLQAGVTSGVHYWEFEVDSLARDGGLVMGIVAKGEFDALKQNVAAQGKSFGLSITGDIGDGTGSFIPFAEPYGQGDVIGMLVDFSKGPATVRFFKNQKDVGVAALDSLAKCPLVPAVCMGGSPPGESISVSVRPGRQPPSQGGVLCVRFLTAAVTDWKALISNDE